MAGVGMIATATRVVQVFREIQKDLENFDKKCFALTTHGITSKNINQNLKKLLMLQMENGGISLYKYLNNTYITKSQFNIFNNLYIDLLINGIMPMNRKMNHNDVKSDNIVYDNKNIRLIDWGETYIQNNKITSRNINKNLNKLLMLQMDNGGISLFNYINKTYFNKALFNILNNSYIDLLKNGILPMNLKGVIHNDVKSDNMVYNNKNLRLIDWGEVFIQHKKKKQFNQAFQFNLPFSNCLFNEYFIKWYSSQIQQLKKTSNNITFYKYKIIAIKWIYYILELKGSHYDFIKSIFKNILSLELDNNVVTYTYVIGYISSYIANIFKKYTNIASNSINLDKYHNEVYIKNIDVWGFLTSYADMVFVYNSSPKKFDMSDTNKSILINKIIDLLMKYLYSNNYSIKPINTNELISDLRDLNFNVTAHKPKTTRKTN